MIYRTTPWNSTYPEFLAIQLQSNKNPILNDNIIRLNHSKLKTNEWPRKEQTHEKLYRVWIYLFFFRLLMKVEKRIVFVCDEVYFYFCNSKFRIWKRERWKEHKVAISIIGMSMSIVRTMSSELWAPGSSFSIFFYGMNKRFGERKWKNICLFVAINKRLSSAWHYSVECVSSCVL